jgi:hypothetical protein
MIGKFVLFVVVGGGGGGGCPDTLDGGQSL